MLKSQVGCAILKDGLGAQFEKDSGGNRPLSVSGNGDEAHVSRYDMLKYAPKEAEGLGRQSMPLARLTVQGVEGPDPFQTMRNLYLQPGALGLSNCAPHSAFESAEQPFFIGGQLQSVLVERERRGNSIDDSSAAPALKVPPTSPFSKLERLVEEVFPG